jgi:hypothetical protein
VSTNLLQDFMFPESFSFVEFLAKSPSRAGSSLQKERGRQRGQHKAWSAFLGMRPTGRPGRARRRNPCLAASAGVYKNVGYKAGAWHDEGWWRLDLQPQILNPNPPLAFQKGLLYFVVLFLIGKFRLTDKSIEIEKFTCLAYFIMF